MDFQGKVHSNYLYVSCSLLTTPTIRYLVLSIVLYSNISLASNDQVFSQSTSEVSEDEFVDIMLGKREGPKSPTMVIKRDNEPQSMDSEPSIQTGKTVILDVSPDSLNKTGSTTTVFSGEDRTPEMIASDETRAIRHIVNHIHRTGILAQGRGKKLLAKQYSISQLEADRLYDWSVLMQDKTAAFVQAKNRKHCLSFMRDKEKYGVKVAYGKIINYEDDTDTSVFDVWKKAEEDLVKVVSESTSQIVVKRIELRNSEYEENTHYVTIIEDDHEIPESLIIASYIDWCENHVLRVE